MYDFHQDTFCSLEDLSLVQHLHKSSPPLDTCAQTFYLIDSIVIFISSTPLNSYKFFAFLVKTLRNSNILMISYILLHSTPNALVHSSRAMNVWGYFPYLKMNLLQSSPRLLSFLEMWASKESFLKNNQYLPMWKWT